MCVPTEKHHECDERCHGVPRGARCGGAALPPLARQPVGGAGGVCGLGGILEVHTCRFTHHQKRPDVSSVCMCVAFDTYSSSMLSHPFLFFIFIILFLSIPPFTVEAEIG